MDMKGHSEKIKTVLRILKRLARPRRWRDKNELKRLFRTAFAGEAGDAVLLNLAEKFHLGEPIKDDDFMNGERNVVLYIISMTFTPIEAAPAQAQAETRDDEW